MAERSYALEMANLLDPKKVYFNFKVISQDDCTQKYQKGLDVLLGKESAVVILDDTELVSVVANLEHLLSAYNFNGSCILCYLLLL